MDPQRGREPYTAKSGNVLPKKRKINLLVRFPMTRQPAEQMGRRRATAARPPGTLGAQQCRGHVGNPRAIPRPASVITPEASIAARETAEVSSLSGVGLEEQ